ncbi:hypothetical protein BAUCODRAFT_32791 [Baudoinia panamericana UAMH 10762]|uniref:Uncharacterized protein n=1 Tax=Baudoinia panamericana (strain UAMH 10762) TaxID=717646 RepID=M2NCX9_BAUPA|nr:uncharacterized protein BAUCODRAFT_32791 [Baudoinia panamericana UAMH 10762]EMC97049.1 hypothetical protein BAUCODRAFT_32791 [Baudoinia panamericana UAMH 10762]
MVEGPVQHCCLARGLQKLKVVDCFVATCAMLPAETQGLATCAQRPNPGITDEVQETAASMMFTPLCRTLPF